MKKTIVNICRLLLAVVFLFSGFVKANDPIGMAYKIADYCAAFGIPSLDWVNIVLAVSLACFEFVLGCCLFLKRKSVSWLMLVVMVFLTALTAYIYVKNPVSDCGCFGDAIILTNAQTLAKNCILLFAALVLVVWYRHLKFFFSRKWGWSVALLAFVAVLAYSVYSLLYLPVIDFRPYKVGFDMNERVEIPGEEANGVKATRYDAAGFYVQTTDGDDITYELFESEGPVFVIVAPNLSEASDGSVGEINNLYEYSKLNGNPFYFLTASDEQQREEWREETDAEYPFCLSDDRVLKTIVRANPGLVVIDHGVIVSKSGNLTLGNEINQLIHKINQ